VSRTREIAALGIATLYGLSIVFDLGDFKLTTKIVGFSISIVYLVATFFAFHPKVSLIRSRCIKVLATRPLFILALLWQAVIIYLLANVASDRSQVFFSRLLGFQSIHPTFIDSTYGLEKMRDCGLIELNSNCATDYPTPATWLLKMPWVSSEGFDTLTAAVITLWALALVLTRTRLSTDTGKVLLTFFTFSPAITFALERANLDLLIGAINLFIAIILNSEFYGRYRRSSFIFVCCLVALESQLKVYPVILFLGLMIVSKKMERVVAVVFLLVNCFAGIYFFGWIEISSRISKPTWTGFGLRNFYDQIVSFTEVTGFVSVVILIIFFCAAYFSEKRQTNRFVAAEFSAAYLIYITGIWIIGESYPYRFVILLPLIVLFEQDKRSRSEIYWAVICFTFMFQSDLIINLAMIFLSVRFIVVPLVGSLKPCKRMSNS